MKKQMVVSGVMWYEAVSNFKITPDTLLKDQKPDTLSDKSSFV